jgi:hypothetical protein
MVAAVVAGSLLFAAASSHAAVTLGSALQTEPNGNTTCSFGMSTRGCLAIDDTLPGRDLVAPFDGVIVRWRARLGDSTQAQTVRLRVVRRLDPDQFTAIATGALEDVAAGAGMYDFPAQLPIKSGDQLGLEEGSNLAIEWRAPLPGALSFEYNPSPDDGADTLAPAFTDLDEEHTFNVDVERDCDSDGLGDETQDPTAFGPNCPHSRTLTLDTSKRKVKKGKKVAFSGQLDSSGNEPTCESGQTLALQRKKPTKTTFATFDQVQTGATGNFSTKEKVRKTFQYRALVAKSPHCDDALSNNRKVKVKKPK